MPTDTTKLPTLARQIHDLRRGRGWSQPDLAAKIGIHPTMIGRYERGEMMPAVDVVAKIAEVFAVTIDYIYHNSGVPNALQDRTMIDRWTALNALSPQDRAFILAAFDGLLRDAKARQAYRQSSESPPEPTG